MGHEFTIKELIDKALRQYNFDDSIVRGRVAQAYEQAVGEFIMKLTRSVRYEVATHTLFVTLASPALKNELTYKTSDLIGAVNKHYGSQEVKKIIFR